MDSEEEGTEEENETAPLTLEEEQQVRSLLDAVLDKKRDQDLEPRPYGYT